MPIRFILFFLCSSQLCYSQFQLKQHIGQSKSPTGTDKMCLIPNYLGSFAESGYHKSDTVNDFTLYDLDGKEFTLSKILQDGKPIVLISSSYTCPVFRGKVPVINRLFDQYKGQVNFFIVYTVEAHPNIDISPYFGRVNTGAANVNENILYRQPVLYNDRLNIVKDMLKNMNINVQILVDGPCNEWWLHYGPAPNNMTLINSNGTVFFKHDWINRTPNDLECDIKKLLNGIIDCNVSKTGDFKHSILSDTIIKGNIGDILYGRGKLENTSIERVEILAVRLKKNLPLEWESSMCMDVCYGTDVDTAIFYIEPGQFLEYYIDFFTSQTPGTGNLKLGFVNTSNSANRYSVTYRAITDLSSSTALVNSELPFASPNPMQNRVRIINADYISAWKVIDWYGRLVKSIDGTFEFDASSLPQGIYMIQYFDSGRSLIRSEKLVK